MKGAELVVRCQGCAHCRDPKHLAPAHTLTARRTPGTACILPLTSVPLLWRWQWWCGGGVVVCGYMYRGGGNGAQLHVPCQGPAGVGGQVHGVDEQLLRRRRQRIRQRVPPAPPRNSACGWLSGMQRWRGERAQEGQGGEGRATRGARTVSRARECCRTACAARRRAHSPTPRGTLYTCNRGGVCVCLRAAMTSFVCLRATMSVCVPPCLCAIGCAGWRLHVLWPLGHRG